MERWINNFSDVFWQQGGIPKSSILIGFSIINHPFCSNKLGPGNLQVPGVMNARQPPCLEGAWIRPDGICTPNCQEGYAPNHASFTCSLEGPWIFCRIFLGSSCYVVLLAIDGMLMVIVFVLSWHFSLSSFGKLWLLFFDDSQRFWVLCLSAPCFEVHQMVPICCHWAIPALQFGWMKLQWMSLATDQRITNLPPLPQHLILGFWWGGQSSLFSSPRKNSGRRRSTEEPEMVVVSKLTPKLLVGNTRYDYINMWFD